MFYGDISSRGHSVLEDFSTDLTNYSGDTGYATRTTTTSISGNALKITAGYIEIWDNNIGTQQGDVYELWMRTASSCEFAFGLSQSTTSDEAGYLIRLYPSASNPKVRIIKEFSSSTPTILAETNMSVNTGTWYKFRVEWDTNGDIDVTVSDANNNYIGSVSANDTGYTSGGLGWQSGSSSPHYMDELVVFR